LRFDSEDDSLESRIIDAPVLGDLNWMEDFPGAFAFRSVTSFPWLDERKGGTEMGVGVKGVLGG
jgi:hypothetical protein